MQLAHQRKEKLKQMDEKARLEAEEKSTKNIQNLFVIMFVYYLGTRKKRTKLKNMRNFTILVASNKWKKYGRKKMVWKKTNLTLALSSIFMVRQQDTIVLPCIYTTHLLYAHVQTPMGMRCWIC